MEILDRVVVDGMFEGEEFIEEEGIIVGVRYDSVYADLLYLVAFDSWNNGHCGYDYGEEELLTQKYRRGSNCWWVRGDVIRTTTTTPNDANFPYRHIINKIKHMEQKRKDLGYKTYQL